MSRTKSAVTTLKEDVIVETRGCRAACVCTFLFFEFDGFNRGRRYRALCIMVGGERGRMQRADISRNMPEKELRSNLTGHGDIMEVHLRKE